MGFHGWSVRNLLICCVIALATYLIPGLSAECIEFPEIPASNYDRNYSYITEEGKRPLGFLASTVYYDSNEETCFYVDGLGGHSIEVVFETVPSQVLCFSDQSDRKRCGENFNECMRSSASRMDFTFSCDVSEGCSESDVTFWLRITKGPASADDPEGMWCQLRDSRTPESIAPLPPNYTPAPTIPPNPSCGFCISSLLSLALTSMLLSLLLIW